MGEVPLDELIRRDRVCEAEKKAKLLARKQRVPDFHEQAFHIWLTLGKERSFTAVAEKLEMGESAISRWAKAENWTARLAEFEESVALALLDKSRTDLVEAKSYYHEQIKEMQDLLRSAIDTVMEIDKATGKPTLTIKITRPGELTATVKALKDLIEFDLSLIGLPIPKSAGKVFNTLNIFGKMSKEDQIGYLRGTKSLEDAECSEEADSQETTE